MWFVPNASRFVRFLPYCSSVTAVPERKLGLLDLITEAVVAFRCCPETLSSREFR